jgi:hypothetical protein
MSPDEMRANVQECEWKAHTRELRASKMYADLARQWRELADEVEKQTRESVAIDRCRSRSRVPALNGKTIE